jgi:hypothetical protein
VIENIPQELRELKQWVLSENDTKLPIQINGKSKAMSNITNTWATFTNAVNALRQNNDGFCGIAFAIQQENGLVFLDLDDCIENGILTEKARHIVDTVDTYTELSVNKTGLHIILKANIEIFHNEKPIECWSYGHFCTITGDIFENRSVINEREAELQEIIKTYSLIKPKSTPRAYSIPTEHSRQEIEFIINRELDKAVGNASEGNRHNTGMYLACQLRDNRIDYTEAEEVMIKYQSMVPEGDRPYPLTEALATLESIYKDTPREPSYQKRINPGGNHNNIDKTSKADDLMTTEQKEAEPKDKKSSELDKHKSELQTILGKHDLNTDEGKKRALHEAESYIKSITNPNITGGLWNIIKKELNLTDVEKDIALTFKSAKELSKMDIPEISWIVPGIIPEGLTLLCGKPKMGKSWLALGLGVGIAGGGRAFGDIDLYEYQGKVLYLALEDNDRRMKNRLTKLCMGSEFPENLTYVTEIKRGAEGIKIIKSWLEKNKEDVRLVVIDTLVSFRGKSSGKINEYDRDSNDMQSIQQLAGDYGIGIILVHHLRKAIADDDFDTISGTLGLTGKADTNLILKRARGEADAILKGTGRDLDEDIDFNLKFDPSNAIWNIVSRDTKEYTINQEREDILKTLQENKEGIKISEISIITGRKMQNLRQILYRMKKEGIVILTKDDKYIIR